MRKRRGEGKAKRKRGRDKGKAYHVITHMPKISPTNAPIAEPKNEDKISKGIGIISHCNYHYTTFSVLSQGACQLHKLPDIADSS